MSKSEPTGAAARRRVAWTPPAWTIAAAMLVAAIATIVLVVVAQ